MRKVIITHIVSTVRGWVLFIKHSSITKHPIGSVMLSIILGACTSGYQPSPQELDNFSTHKISDNGAGAETTAKLGQQPGQGWHYDGAIIKPDHDEIDYADTINSVPEHMWRMLQGADLHQSLTEYGLLSGYSRIIFDLHDSDINARFLSAHKSVGVTSLKLVELQQAFNEALPFEAHKIYFYKANDADEIALLVTDYAIPQANNLVVFDLEMGSLFDNAKKIAWFYQWNVKQNAWQLPTDYTVKYDYAMVAQSIVDAYIKLFQRYPIQVQLIQNSRDVVFTSRKLPTN